MKISTHWLKDYVRLKGSLEEIADRVTLTGLEVKSFEKAKEGLLWETEITSNRPDWLSYLGVAREISALYSTPLKQPKISAPKKLVPFPQDFSIETKDLELCPYYTGTILKGIKPCPTPDYMKERLEIAGLRPVNFLVDVTNFVLLECGQPLHAFDLNLIKGRKIIIRRAKPGEVIVAIDGKSYELAKSDCVIADESHPVAIAGVMGGKESEVSGSTQDILLESAFFKPSAVRLTSKKFALSTDSSYRFERRVDPEGVLWARDRVISLILENTTVEEISRVKTVGRKPSKQKTVVLPFEKMDRLLGTKIPPAKTAEMFKNLGMKVIQKNQKLIKVAVPSFRPDLTQAADLIEEAARIYGYNRIPETLPNLVTLQSTIVPKPKFEIIKKTADLFAGAGFYEAQNFSIIRSGVYGNYLSDQSKLVKIDNPQNKELDLMRPSLIPGLIETAQRNQYRGNKYFKFFEIGQIYAAKGKELPDESVSLAMMGYGTAQKTWSETPREVDVFNIKGSIEVLLETLGIEGAEWKEADSIWMEKGTGLGLYLKGKQVGCVGEAGSGILKTFDMEGPLALAEIDLQKLIPLVSKERKFHALSKYPAITRDFSLLVPKELPVESVRSTILEEGNELLRDVYLFDIYEGKNTPAGVKSLAFTCEYQSHERTLSSEEIQKEHARIASVIQEKYNAQLPSAKS